jgi:hypothetical protein
MLDLENLKHIWVNVHLRHVQSKMKLFDYLLWRCSWVCVFVRTRVCVCARARVYSFYLFLILAVGGGAWSASHPGCTLPSEKGLSSHQTGVWVGPGAGLGTAVRGKILCLCWGSNPVCPVSHYIDWAVPVRRHKTVGSKILKTILLWSFTK